MRLKKVEIHKYKSFETSQKFDVDEDITILVGMNESGKTSALEAIAKTNYFQDDEAFKFNLTHDFPRKEKKKIDKDGSTPKAVTCTYSIPQWIQNQIAREVGEDVFTSTSFSVTTYYKSKKRTFGGVSADLKKFVAFKTDQLKISSNSLNEKLEKLTTKEEFDALAATFKDENYVEAFGKLSKYFSFTWSFPNPIEDYITRIYLDTNLPKFLYYDEYFSLPSRINIEKLENDELDESEFKTAKALFELADINTSEILEATDFEDFVAELEATEAIITNELFKYWQTNKNLGISFRIDKVESTDARNNTRIVEHVLDIRVKGRSVSLPLKNRSKGFNWFFSFLVWFKRIQEDEDNSYVLLLDEPGLNLHASAQADLLRFLDDLAEDYQVIYTTHSPFMIPSGSLSRVRTVLETDSGSIISDSIQEKDPNTLFPLQAALGYDIAQNLFVSSRNLLVEGVSDLIVLTALSSTLESMGKEGLRDDITIVPTGGLEKVATFISLLRGSKLEIACLLDSYAGAKGKAKMEKMIREKIIHQNKVRFFDEYLDNKAKADLEDLFKNEEYLKLFNTAFSEHKDLKLSDIQDQNGRIIVQINLALGIDRFNHYRPANQLVKDGSIDKVLSSETVDRFEQVFKSINKLYE